MAAADSVVVWAKTRGIVPTNASKIERMVVVDVWTMLLYSGTTLLHEDTQNREAEMSLSSVRWRKAGRLTRLRLRAALLWMSEDWRIPRNNKNTRGE